MPKNFRVIVYHNIYAKSIVGISNYFNVILFVNENSFSFYNEIVSFSALLNGSYASIASTKSFEPPFIMGISGPLTFTRALSIPYRKGPPSCARWC
jgi:hypothetical protein